MKFDNVIRWAAVVILILTVVAVVVGTLAIPVILALAFSYYWMFLYAAYAVVVLSCIARCFPCLNGNGRRRYKSSTDRN